MKDLRDILARAKQLETEQKSYAIATIVGTTSSTYRGIGSRMLIEQDRTTGVISGSCLEDDLQNSAQRVIRHNNPELIEYDYTKKDDYLFGTGMGCSGQLQIMLTPMPSKNGQHIITTLENVIENKNHKILLTIIDSEKHSTFSTADTFSFSSQRIQNLPEELRSSIHDFLQQIPICNNGSIRSFRKTFNGIKTLLEIFSPPMTLTVFGSGDDSKPLIKNGIDLGWELQLVDHRPAMANISRFPNVKKIYCAPAGQWPHELKIPLNSAAVVMSHNYLQDQAMLKKLLTLPLTYLGVLGSHKRNKKLFAELEKNGIFPTNPKNLYSPAGLDLGGDCPQAIALSIIAEIHKTIYDASADSISRNQGPIHNRKQHSNQSLVN
tara:strand:+ start:78 stop:1214 length:1137 start_codon:yes stop_codon:yes gene_type:complete